MKPQLRAVMFANLDAGGAKRSFVSAVTLLQAAGVEISSLHVDLGRNDVVKALDNAQALGIRLLIAFGGDGTISSIVDVIGPGTEMVLGVIPAGTSNNFARSLGIRPNFRSGVGVITSGSEGLVDLGAVNGHYFIHAAIMGLNVEFAEEAQRLRRVLGRLSYPFAALIVYRRMKLMGASLVTEGRWHDLKAYQIAVLNASESMDLLLSKDPVMADHRLRILIVQDLRLRTVVKNLPRIFFQRHLGLPCTGAFALEEGRIETSQPLPMTLDGEIKTHTPADFRIIPGSLRVMIPSPTSH